MKENTSEHPDYPVEISLGKTVKEYPIPTSPSGKKTEKEPTICPCLYLSEIPGLESLPNEGHALIYFRKKRVVEDMDTEGKESGVSVDLEIQEIHLPERNEVEEKDDMEKEMRSMLETDDEDEATEPKSEDEEEIDEEE